jgi:hypothetical protein
MKHSFFLHDLGDEKEPFYSLAATKIVEGRPTTERRLRCSSTAAVVASGGALASETVLAMVVIVGGPPSSGLAQDALVQWVSECVLGDLWRLGGGQ